MRAESFGWILTSEFSGRRNPRQPRSWSRIGSTLVSPDIGLLRIDSGCGLASDDHRAHRPGARDCSILLTLGARAGSRVAQTLRRNVNVVITFTTRFAGRIEFRTATSRRPK